VTLRAVELAVTVHLGPHDDIDVTYGRLGVLWSTTRLPVEETYLVGPQDDPEPVSWRTEIGWPVFRVSGP
jgi:hypothetical protein